MKTPFSELMSKNGPRVLRPLSFGFRIAPGSGRPSSRPCIAASLMGLILFAGALSVSGCSEEAEEAHMVMTASDSLVVDVLIGLHALDSRMYEVAFEQSEEDDNASFTFSDRTGRDSVLSAYGLSDDAFMGLIDAQLQDPEHFLFLYNAVLDRSTVR
jgi:hypothetical protein